jgi:hypothetical protein
MVRFRLTRGLVIGVKARKERVVPVGIWPSRGLSRTHPVESFGPFGKTIVWWPRPPHARGAIAVQTLRHDDSTESIESDDEHRSSNEPLVAVPIAAH